MGLADPALIESVASKLGFSANEAGTIIEHYLEAENAADEAARAKDREETAARAKAEDEAKAKAAAASKAKTGTPKAS